MSKVFQHPLYLSHEVREPRMLWTVARNKTESRKIAEAVTDTLRWEIGALAMATTIFDWDEPTLITAPPYITHHQGQGRLFTTSDLNLSESELVQSIRDDITAIHVAAHAVIHEMMEIEVESVTIEEEEDFLGHCVFKPSGIQYMIGRVIPGVVAGELAEHYFVNSVPNFAIELLNGEDSALALDSATKKYESRRMTTRYDIETGQFFAPPEMPDDGDEAEVRKLVQNCMAETYDDLQQNWPTVLAVASILTKDRTLTGSEVRRIIRTRRRVRPRAA